MFLSASHHLVRSLFKIMMHKCQCFPSTVESQEVFSLGCRSQWNDSALIMNMAFQSQLINCSAFSVLTKPSFWHSVPRAYKLKPVECLHRQQEHGELHLSLPHWPGWTKWCWCAGMISMHRMLIKGAPWSPIFSLAPQQWVGSTEDKTAENEQLPCHFHSNLSMNTFVYGDTSKILQL